MSEIKLLNTKTRWLLLGEMHISRDETACALCGLSHSTYLETNEPCRATLSGFKARSEDRSVPSLREPRWSE